MSRIKRPLTSQKKALLLLFDLVLLATSFTIVGYLRFGKWDWAWGVEPTTGLVGSLAVISFYIFGTYDLDDEGASFLPAIRVGLALSLTLIAVLGLNYLLNLDRSGYFGRGVLLGGLFVDFLFASAFRCAWRFNLLREGMGRKWLVLVSPGDPSRVQKLLEENLLHGSLHLHELKEDDPQSAADFRALLSADWTGIILAAPESEWNRWGTELVHARLHGTVVVPLSSIFEHILEKLPVEHLDHDWFLRSDGFNLINSATGQRVKRLVDIGAATLLFFCAWPFMLLTAVGVRVDSQGPILYRQRRTGLGGDDFVIFKFRSMRQDAEVGGVQWAQKNDTRVTKFGSFIRKTRLDELPQLWNVFCGDMSFIGPRPERPEFNQSLELEIPYYQLRHLIRPGITGWAQVMYPYGASSEDAKRKLEYDLFYIKNYDVFLDLRIILKTIRIILFARGR